MHDVFPSAGPLTCASKGDRICLDPSPDANFMYWQVDQCGWDHVELWVVKRCRRIDGRTEQADSKGKRRRNHNRYDYDRGALLIERLRRIGSREHEEC